jgi:hypothetical protein
MSEPDSTVRHEPQPLFIPDITSEEPIADACAKWKGDAEHDA